MIGKVLWFNSKKGYGFIESGGNDYFFHRVNVKSSVISEGDSVEFDVTEGEKGPKALNVEVRRFNP